jgi:4-hydroxybenzoate polyprenyltransferase
MAIPLAPGPTRPADIAEPIRLPAALTVPGGVLLGAVAAGRRPDSRAMALTASSVALHGAGMALDDWADRHLDTAERPERPIPSGRVTHRTTRCLAAGLTLGSLALTHLAAGRRALLTRALPFAATVWWYDPGRRSTARGPATMALPCALDVLHGTGAGPMRGALLPAAVIAAHTHAVTRLSRHEGDGRAGTEPYIALATTTAPSLVAGAAPGPRIRATPAARTPIPTLRALTAATVVSASATTPYAATAAPARLVAVRQPGAARVRAAVGAGIHAFLPLQGALLSRAGRPVLGGLLAAALPLARRSARKVSPT